MQRTAAACYWLWLHHSSPPARWGPDVQLHACALCQRLPLHTYSASAKQLPPTHSLRPSPGSCSPLSGSCRTKGSCCNTKHVCERDGQFDELGTCTTVRLLRCVCCACCRWPWQHARSPSLPAVLAHAWWNAAASWRCGWTDMRVLVRCRCPVKCIDEGSSGCSSVSDCCDKSLFCQKGDTELTTLGKCSTVRARPFSSLCKLCRPRRQDLMPTPQ